MVASKSLTPGLLLLESQLAQIAAGDDAGLSGLYMATSATLYRTIKRILIDANESEDILQDVYLRIWRAAGQYQPGVGSPISWLMKIARNCAIDRLRKLAWTDLDPDNAMALQLVDQSPCAISQIETAQRSRRIGQMVDALSPKAARALRLAFYEGVTYAVVAERMNLPQGTAKSIIRRSLERLRPQAEVL